MRRFLSGIGIYVLALTTCMIPAVLNAQTYPAQGSCRPVLAFNLAPAVDWHPGVPFLNIMKSSRPWLGHKPKQWGGMTLQELRAGGYIDEAGWVTSIPPGISHVGTSFSWQNSPQADAYRAGRYIITYKGRGDFSFKAAKVVSRQPGRIVIDIPPSKGWHLNVTNIDPQGVGDYIRDIEIVHEKHLALYQAGAVFHPDWIALIKDARQLRFMDWLGTNNSEVVSWADRAPTNGPLGPEGHALEDIVRLANEIGADPWFTMPHKADETYIRQFATYVRDTLDPRLTARVEWSNEVWNWGFKQTSWSRREAEARWGEAAFADLKALKTVEMARIWKDVFKVPGSPELRIVIATQTVNAALTKSLLYAPRWRHHDPADYVPPHTMYDELAITTYFGGPLTGKPEERNALWAVMQNAPQETDRYLSQRLRDPDVVLSLPYVRNILSTQKQLANEVALSLIAYEGGQHVHHNIVPKVPGSVFTREQVDQMHDVVGRFVRSPRMAALYSELWADWAEIGQGPFMQYTDVSSSARHGSWGLYNSLHDANPRARMIKRLAGKTSPWWEGAETCQDQYQHGTTAYGTDQADRLTGTREEDYLIGFAGPDIFFGGPGDDGMNGGPGQDQAHFSGSRDAYRIVPQKDGHQVIGADGRDFLIHIEELHFNDGQIIHLP